MQWNRMWIWCGVLLALWPDSLRADVSSAIQAIQSVGHNGEGHAAAQQAVRELGQADASSLTTILIALDESNPLAANWLRGAFESVAARAQQSAAGLPVAELRTFYQNRKHDPRARRLAYEWIIRAKPELTEELIAAAVDDPSAEMRRDAVDRLLNQARLAEAEGQQAEAISTLQQALSAAGEPSQVDPIAKELEKLGVKVDRVDHYGMLTEWHVIGPFDNREMKGFPVEYPPEQTVDLKAVYDGQKGEVRWTKYVTEADDGKFDLAKLTEPHKGAIDYVTAEFQSDRAQPVEFRLATPNAWKLWLNGELLFAREEYHRGMRFDQYRIPGALKAGTNRILIKVCQNEQDQSWAQDWCFQFRVCDPYGRALHAITQVAEQSR
ncbi:MAG: hypothetical protein ACK5Q5_21815 [Planctomycetaceae bacterium]